MSPLSHACLGLALVVALGSSGCASAPPSLASDPVPPTAEEFGTVTYHDDNSDGVVDFEMHDFGCCDRNWALVDSDFDGTFDLRVQWGESFTEEPVEQPVPSLVSIAPRGSGWLR